MDEKADADKAGGAPGEGEQSETRHDRTNVRPTTAAPPIDNSVTRSSAAGAAYSSGQHPQDQSAAVGQAHVQLQQTPYNDVNALLLQQLLRQVQTSMASAAPQQHPTVAQPFGTVGMPGLANPAQHQHQVTATNITFAPPPAAADATAQTASSNTAIAASSQAPQELLSAVQQLILQNQIAGINAPQQQPPPTTTGTILQNQIAGMNEPIKAPQPQPPTATTGTFTHLPLTAENPTNTLQMNQPLSNSVAAVGGTISSTGAASAVPVAFGSSVANISTQQQQINILGGLVQALLQGQAQQQQQQPQTVPGSTTTGGGVQIPQSVPPELLQQLQLLLYPTVGTGVASSNLSTGIIPSMVSATQPQQIPLPIHGHVLQTSSSSAAHIGQNLGHNMTQFYTQQQSQVTRTPSSSLSGTSGKHSDAAASRITGRKPVSLYLSFDSTSLNQFQCLLRQQIEVFETPLHQARSSQGRNTPIVAGQVGIRCKWCFNGIQTSKPVKGCLYYSKKMDGIYQVAQNLAKAHFLSSGPTSCPNIPHDIKNRLMASHSTAKRGGAGKSYWTDGLRALGVYEDNNILRFRPLTSTIQRQRQASEHSSRSLPSSDDATKDDRVDETTKSRLLK